MWRLLIFLGTALVSACTYRAGGIESPITRKFQYFSYLNADDIRANCVAGTPAQYRLVYNAVYSEQVRAYDLRRSATGEGAVLWTQVFGGGGNVSSFNPLDPTGPWRGASAETRLSEASYRDLIRTVEASGFGGPAPAGLTLPSWGFYWIVAACADGRFHYNAWLFPSDRFSQISFAKVLFDNDRTGVPVNAPWPQDAAQYRLRSGQSYQDPSVDFELKLGSNGLVGHGSLF